MDIDARKAIDVTEGLDRWLAPGRESRLLSAALYRKRIELRVCEIESAIPDSEPW